ncbi:MAG: ferritin-like domain-containing protein [Sphaerochaetaceae bacterium]|jgi:ferritin-like protein|nr:ferritin-like domain-containing protein [Sphaerochaetaceae bacterium]MDD3942439.1 ferritin-like domain-containing protein [Sphaerochaetaceae bacterium]MDX9940378.1 ferritin-like domain-containing protein [Sphaerochaetaceae bacterium]
MAYSEPYDALDEKTREISRAITSLREELEAIDWYNQRVATSKDASLKEVMAHNRDEEIEHACMTIEWLRRNMEKWDDELRDYLFTNGSLIAVEEGAASTEDSGSALSIGTMKE